MTDPGNQRPPDEPPETEQERWIVNIFLLVFFVVIVGAGVWLFNTMVDQRKLDDCLAQGRRNCAPIEAPSR
jgi:hypothetical protein